MELLYTNITNMPADNKIISVYLVDGQLKYATLQDIKSDIYNLYTISNYRLSEIIGSNESPTYFDLELMSKYMPIVSMSMANENDIRVVKIRTNAIPDNCYKKPKTDKKEINTYHSRRVHKLF